MGWKWRAYFSVVALLQLAIVGGAIWVHSRPSAPTPAWLTDVKRRAVRPPDARPTYRLPVSSDLLPDEDLKQWSEQVKKAKRLDR